jgi:hypothetical protein
MTLEAKPEKIVWACGVGDLQPFPRPAGDGTYEVVVPLAGCPVPVILPYFFSSEEDGMLWISSPKGSKRIERARIIFE